MDVNVSKTQSSAAKPFVKGMNVIPALHPNMA